MSYSRPITIHPININRFLKHKLKSETRFSDAEKASLKRFQELEKDPDHIFLWACAQMAANDMAQLEPNLALTRYGVTDRNYMDIDKGTIISTYDADKGRYDTEDSVQEWIIEQNQKFLAAWEAKIQLMMRQRDKINELTQETRDLIDANVYGVYAIRMVVRSLIEDGFSPTDPNVVNTPASVAFTKGVHIRAENELGDVRDVYLFLPGGKHKVHVDTADRTKCTDEAAKFANKITELLEELSAASIPIVAGVEGYITDTNSDADEPNPELLVHQYTPEKQKV